MFTMKKLAALAVVGFMASSMVACSDDDDNGAPEPKKFSDEWEKSGSATLGNGTKGNAGSFLDADAITVYKKTEAEAKKAVIDLVLTGDQFITPGGCATVDFCRTELAGGNDEAAFITGLSTSSLNETSSPDDISNLVTEEFDNIVVKTFAEVAKDGKYLMFTDKGLAFIIVNGEVGNEATLSIAWISEAKLYGEEP